MSGDKYPWESVRWHALDDAEIAAMLGCTVETVRKTRKQRGYPKRPAKPKGGP